MFHRDLTAHFNHLRGEVFAARPIDHPISLQLGGSDPSTLAAAAAVAEQLGYDEESLLQAAWHVSYNTDTLA